ncbi:MAG: SCO family protein [Oligoflexia bacterium]|nr:SCO family protein [Oligoflexia bacterium]
MKSKKDILINIFIIVAIIIGFIVITFMTSQPPPKTVSFESQGLQVPLIPLSGKDKAPITLKEFRGKNILINFWASWCKGCQAEEESLKKIAVYKGHAVEMIGIASSDKLSDLERSGKLKDNPLDQFLEESGNLALAFNVKSLPQTLLIDSQGRVLSHFKNVLSEEDVKILNTQLDLLNGSIGVLGEVPKFKLRSSHGEQVTEQTLQNKVWVANFIFTSCPGQCPILTSKMKQLQDKFRDNENFKLVSVTVDPNKDTPAVLKKYQEKYGANSDNWYFLTGKYGPIKKLIGAGFKLGTPENPDFHTTKFVLMDGVGQIRGYYDVDETGILEKLKSDIIKLLDFNPR